MAASQKGEGRGGRAPDAARQASLGFVAEVPLRLTVEIGSTRMRVKDVLQLEKGSIVELDRTSGEPADVLVNGRLVARGDLSVVDERLAVTITEVVGSEPGPADGAP